MKKEKTLDQLSYAELDVDLNIVTYLAEDHTQMSEYKRTLIECYKSHCRIWNKQVEKFEGLCPTIQLLNSLIIDFISKYDVEVFGKDPCDVFKFCKMKIRNIRDSRFPARKKILK